MERHLSAQLYLRQCLHPVISLYNRLDILGARQQLSPLVFSPMIPLLIMLPAKSPDQELAYDLGENAAQIGGGIAGAALAGAAVGSVVPGAGTVVGFGAGLVGGMVGCAVASEAYASAVEFGAENVDALADKAQEMANKTVDIAKKLFLIKSIMLLRLLMILYQRITCRFIFDKDCAINTSIYCKGEHRWI